MKTIWKFELDFGTTVIDVPQGGEILTMQIQENIPCVWINIESKNDKEKRTFATVGTGHPIEFKNKYIGTYQQGALVWHILEVLK